MQFQNAVITPDGIRLLSAASINKPVKFTRFLFTDSTTRLTGSETELPPNTWGNGSIDAALPQGEASQFTIYASASNEFDHGYARGYGIYAEQDGVEYLVAVANCLGQPTLVTAASGGYTRFNFAITIRYAMNADTVYVQPNLAGLISRAEFQVWIDRVVTTRAPIGSVNEGEDQHIRGVKTFLNTLQVGLYHERFHSIEPGETKIHGDVELTGALLPLRYPASSPGAATPPHEIGSEDNYWDRLYVHELETDKIVPTRAVLVIENLNEALQDDWDYHDIAPNFVAYRKGFIPFLPDHINRLRSVSLRYAYGNTTVDGQRVKSLGNWIGGIKVAVDPDSPFYLADVRWRVLVQGYGVFNVRGEPTIITHEYHPRVQETVFDGDKVIYTLAPMSAPSVMDIRAQDATITIIMELL